MFLGVALMAAIQPACAQIVPEWRRTHHLQGTLYVEAPEVAAWLGMQWRWIEKGRRAEMRSAWTRIELETDRRELLLNGHRIHLGHPVHVFEGHLCLSVSDLRHQLMPILTPQFSGDPPELSHIVLDPGHGGQDPGAENAGLGLREKTLTLDLSLRLAEKLRALGYTVSLTRTEDRFIELPERARLANTFRADLFISIHFNAIGRPDVSGVETFILPPPGQPSTARAERSDADEEILPGHAHQAWSTLAGWYLQDRMVQHLHVADRGLKRARFAVLRGLEMPGVLVEAGFVSNPEEGRLIGQPAYLDQVASALLDGIVQYARTLDRFRTPAASREGRP